MKKQSIYATAKLANKLSRLSATALKPETDADEVWELVKQDSRHARYCSQNFMSLLRALKREHREVKHMDRNLAGRHDARACPTCKLIKKVEEMK